MGGWRAEEGVEGSPCRITRLEWEDWRTIGGYWGRKAWLKGERVGLVRLMRPRCVTGE